MPKKAERKKADRELMAPANDQAREVLRQRLARAAYAARQFTIDAARLLCDDKCEDVVALEVRDVSTICDYFVIATGTSDRQMRAVVDHLRELGKGRGEEPYRVSGYDEGAWIVVDYVDVVVHLFDMEKRSYYDLESLWGDCPRVAWGA